MRGIGAGVVLVGLAWAESLDDSAAIRLNVDGARLLQVIAGEIVDEYEATA